MDGRLTVILSTFPVMLGSKCPSGLFRRCIFFKESERSRTWLIEEFEDTKGVIRIRKSKKDRQHNGQKRDKRTNNDLQNTTQKTKDRVTTTPLKTGGELRKCRQFPFFLWHPSCYSGYKSGDKSWMRKLPVKALTTNGTHSWSFMT